MVSQQFNNQVFYICIAAGKRLAFLCLEDDVLNLLYLSRRTRQTALFRITVYIGYTPFCDIQIRTAFIQRSIRQFSSVFGNGSLFLTTQCTFVLLYQFRIARTARSRTTVYSQYNRKRTFYSFHTSVDMAFHTDTSVFYLLNFFYVGHLRQT